MQVSYDRRAITIDGKRTLLLSGAIHYPRSTPAMWPELLKRSREAGLNAIETYVFWNLHERQRGVFDFSGRLDLLRFCALAQEHGLRVILRIGPYICAEINYGGLPAWLHAVPHLLMRTYNEPFMREMERWVRFLCDALHPMFAPQGGPIMLAQVENEYGLIAKQTGEAGQQYLQWALELGQSLGMGVPLIMCVGSVPGAIETMNGFYAHTQLEQFFPTHPGQPPVWTEHWSGWYDTFGYSHHSRSPENVAYAAARFFAAGGTGMNYYMWHGGTNFGREAMYLQTTSYDYDAPLDEFGLPTTKFRHLARLHAILHDHADTLLASEPAQAQRLGMQQVAYVYAGQGRSLAFLCNDDPEKEADISFQDRPYHLPAQSVTMLEDDRLLMNTARVDAASLIRRTMQPLSRKLAPFAYWHEPMPAQRPDETQARIVREKPVEQLKLTKDETDYCWYTTELVVTSGQEETGVLACEFAADAVHVFVDGQLRATTQGALLEERGPLDGKGFAQSFALELAAGRHEVAILCCALGLIKGDWMIGNQNMVKERKGLGGRICWNGEELAGPWVMQPGLVGERYSVFDDMTGRVQWESDWQAARQRPLCWWRATFDRPQGDAPLALALQGMKKGLAWLNGRCIGRYWLAPALGQPDPLSSWLADRQFTGEPTQRYYHLPADWFADRNVLVLFEELGGDPSSVSLCRWEAKE